MWQSHSHWQRLSLLGRSPFTMDSLSELLGGPPDSLHTTSIQSGHISSLVEPQVSHCSLRCLSIKQIIHSAATQKQPKLYLHRTTYNKGTSKFYTLIVYPGKSCSSPWILCSFCVSPYVSSHLGSATISVPFPYPKGWHFTASAVSLSIHSPGQCHRHCLLALCYPKGWAVHGLLSRDPTYLLPANRATRTRCNSHPLFHGHHRQGC